MWTILTYAYNSILILFIAAHLLVGAIISFLTGLYIGIYLCQNYQIPRITEPSKVWEKVILFMEQYRRTPRSGSSLSSTINLLHPKSVINIVKEDDDPSVAEDNRTGSRNLSQQVVSEDFDDINPSTPNIIFIDPDFRDQGDSDVPQLRKSSSQILEATLIINSPENKESTLQPSSASPSVSSPALSRPLKDD